jgi:hypothetical protein
VAKKSALKKRKAVSDAAPGAQAADAKSGKDTAGGPPAAKRRKKREWWEEELDGQRERRALDVDDDAAYYRAEVRRLQCAVVVPCLVFPCLAPIWALEHLVAREPLQVQHG